MMKVNPIEELFKNSVREQKTPPIKLDKYGFLLAVSVSVLFSMLAMAIFSKNCSALKSTKYN